MNREMLLEAMTDISGEYIRSAERRMAGSVHRIPVRKMILLAAVVAVLASLLLTTVMALSPQLRELVFRVLQIDQRETVPVHTGEAVITPDNMYAEPGFSVGGVLEGKYVHTPSATHARNGIYTICTDPVEMKQGSHYDAYIEKDGTFCKLEEFRFCREVTVCGNRIPIEFEWAANNGAVAITWVDAGADFWLPVQWNGLERYLMELRCMVENEAGEPVECRYPVLANLLTGEVTDLLSGTGVERIGAIVNSAVSDDGKWLLLATEDGMLHCVDLVRKQYYSVDGLSGEHADSCSLIGNVLAGWSVKDGVCQAWSIDLRTMERQEVFADIPVTELVFLSGFDTWVHWGEMTTGARFAVRLRGQQVEVIDLATGAVTVAEGMTWPGICYTDVICTASPDGTKLLIAGGKVGIQYGCIGVLDFTKKTYVEFSRENPNRLQEFVPDWFDNNTVLISTCATEISSEYYVYDLLN